MWKGWACEGTSPPPLYISEGEASWPYTQQSPHSCSWSCFPGRDTKCTGRWIGKPMMKGSPWGEERCFAMVVGLILTHTNRGILYPKPGSWRGSTECRELLDAWQGWRDGIPWTGEGPNMNMMKYCTICLYNVLSTVTTRSQMPKCYFLIVLRNEPAFFLV